MAKKRALKLSLIFLFTFSILFFCAFVYTEMGLRLTVKAVQHYAPSWGMQLKIENARGSLSRAIEIERVLWANENVEVSLKNLRLVWNVKGLLLFSPHLTVDDFFIENLSIQEKKEIGKKEEKIKTEKIKKEVNQNLEDLLPQHIQIPVFFEIKRLFVGEVFYQNESLIRNLSLSLKTAKEKNARHQIEKLSFNYKDLTLQLMGDLALQKPFDLNAQLNVEGNLQKDFPKSPPFSLVAHLKGDFKKLHFDLKGLDGIDFLMNAELFPLNKMPLEKALIELKNFNPQEWGGMLAHLNLNSTLSQKNNVFLGNIQIQNTEKTFPIENLTSDFSFQNEKIHLKNMVLFLMNAAGKINGEGDLDLKQNLNANFTLSTVDFKKISETLPSTAIEGKIELKGNTQNLVAQVDLKNNLSDLPLNLKSKIAFQNDNLIFAPVNLIYKEGSFLGEARYALKTKDFQTQLEFNRLDLKEFLKDTFLNGEMKVAGKLSPWALSSDFSLVKSQFLGKNLNGKGVFKMGADSIEKMDINLNWGENVLNAAGSLGKTGKHLLEMHFNAPLLSFDDFSGNAKINAQFSGSLNNPSLFLKANIKELKNKSGFFLQNFNADLNIHNTLKSGLKGKISLDLLHTENTAQLLREFNFEMEGANNNHQFIFKTRLPNREYLNFKINGAFQSDLLDYAKPKTFWQGTIQSLKYYHRTRGGYSVLPQNKILLGAKYWNVQNLNITTEDGEKYPFKLPLHFVLNGEGNDQKTNILAKLNSLNEKNRLSLESFWQNEGEIYKINSNLPWKISLNAQFNEMAWLSASLGENWELGGQGQADFKITGTPQKPLINGKFNGNNLKLFQSDFLLHLKDGVVNLNIENNLLNLNQFFWKSVLQKPPALLLKQSTDSKSLLKLVETEGEMSASGSLRLLDETHNNARLSLSLNRLGVVQHPDQWLVLSGKAQTLWEKETLALDGDFQLNAGFWRIKDFGTPAVSGDVVVRKSASENNPAPKILWQPKANLKIEMGEHFMFTGFGLNTMLTGNLAILAEGKDLPRAVGRINTKGGRFEAYGQKLFIRQGRLNFDNLATNPALDVEALRFGGRIVPGVKISGTAERPEISLISEPNVPDAEKLSWLVLGHGPEDMSLGDAALLVSAANELLGGNSGGLMNQLTSAVGIDDFNIGQGNLNGNKRRISSRVVGSMQDSASSSNDQILTIGKRLTDRVRLAYEQSLGEADSLLRLFTRLKYGIFFIVSTGSDNTLDFYYRYSFGKPPPTKERTAN